MTLIYVGDLAFTVADEQIGEVSSFGRVLSIKLPTDRETVRLRGLGFVEMSSPDAQKMPLEALTARTWALDPCTRVQARAASFLQR